MVNVGSQLIDLRDCSPVIKAIEPFQLLRAYFADDDKEARKFLDEIIKSGGATWKP